MDGATCAVIVRTPQARLLGVPNSVLGLGFYPFAAWGYFAGVQTALGMAVAATGVATAASAYLFYSLRVRLRVNCPLCFVAHGINVALFALCAAMWLGSSTP